MKKLIALLLSTLMLLALFVACSPKDKEEDDAPAGEDSGDNLLSFGGDNVADDKNWDVLPGA